MIAICILTFNNVEVTKRCIEKVYNNTKTEFTLFIFDNGSSDGTIDYLLNLKQDNCIVFLNKENVGIIDGRNRIWKLIESKYDFEYILFLDNDQFVEPGWDIKYLFLAEKYNIIGKEAWQMKYDFKPFRRIRSESEYFNYIGCGGMMIQKNVVKDIGLFDDQFIFKYFEDPDFCFRANRSGYKIGWCSDNVIIHQKHNLTLSKTEREFFMHNLRIIQNKWRHMPLPKFQNVRE